MYEMNPGEIYYWTRNSIRHPDDPDYNYFIVLENKWGAVLVQFLMDNQRINYAETTFRDNLRYLRKVE